MLYQRLYGFAMAERGGVRRMNTRPSGNKTIKTPHEAKWKKSQDHFECFTNLIGVELDDELSQVQERWKNWSKQKMVTSGLVLFDLVGRTSGRFFGDPILVFEVRGGGQLPFHRFGHGDMVIISRARPWGEKVLEGVVLDRNNSRIRIVAKENQEILEKVDGD